MVPQGRDDSWPHSHLSGEGPMPQKATKKPQAGVTAPEDPLCEHLSKAYTLGRRASKYFDLQRPFKIADSGPNDTWKWSISAGVLDSTPLRLMLVLHSIPRDKRLSQAVGLIGGLVVPEREEHATLVVQFPPDGTGIIRKLAGAIRSVETTKWSWLSNKVADALVRLANHLDQYHAPHPRSGPASPPGGTP